MLLCIITIIIIIMGCAYSCNLHKTIKPFKFKNKIVITLGPLLPPTGFTFDMNTILTVHLNLFCLFARLNFV